MTARRIDDLEQLADLIARRNELASGIAALVGRPAQIGHVGEYVASRIFGIALEESASQKALDGRFTSGNLLGRSVNIKWYAKQEGFLDLTPGALPDYYLVMTGPKAGPISSRWTTRPWVIDAVHLFDAQELVLELQARGGKIGVATSVRQELWRGAEIYPVSRNQRLVLSEEQREMLARFRSHATRR